MTEPSRVGASITLKYDVFQSYVAELRVALDHAEAERLRDALGGAQRAWEYYCAWVLTLLGREPDRRLSLHHKEARTFYEQKTGDTALAQHPSWRSLVESVTLRNSAEHAGKPVSAAEATRAIRVRIELMRHIDATLQRTHGVDARAFAQAAKAREDMVRAHVLKLAAPVA
jgi:hypothetical protein